MASKSKTFVPAIPIPRGWSKKSKKHGPESMQTTDKLKEGIVAGGDKDWQNARPGGGNSIDGPFSDNNREDKTAGIVNSPDNDPEAFDDMTQLG